MKLEGITASPLSWPIDWKRIPTHNRATSKYKSNFQGASAFVRARDGVMRNLKLMGVRRDQDAVLSTNVPLRGDGLPYASFREPDDPGVAVYWIKTYGADATPHVMACDKWRRVWENLHAIELALDSIRSLERTGASQIFDRAFQGFKALPAAPTWRSVLGFSSTERVDRDELNNAYRRASMQHHPDHGGDQTTMAGVNAAYAAAKQELGFR